MSNTRVGAKAKAFSAPFESYAYNNLIINPRMRISQANLTSLISSVNGYTVDQWQVLVNGPLASAQQVASPFATRPDLITGLKINTTTAKSSLSAADYIIIRQPLEGVRIAKLKFGKSFASAIMIGFMAVSNINVVGYINIVNGVTGNRYYSGARFTLAANVETFVSVVIPGDVTGTWNTDTTQGMYLNITLGVGSNYQGTAGVWGSTALFAASDVTNLCATLNNNIIVSDFIMLAIPDTNITPSSIIPFERLPFFEREYQDELRLCQRYFQRYDSMLYGGNTSSGSNVVGSFVYPVYMRVAPSVSFPSVAYANASALGTGLSLAWQWRWQLVVSSTGWGYCDTGACTFDARM